MQFKLVFTTPRYLAIVMEYVAGGDLCDYFIDNNLVGTGLPEDLARWFFQQIILALEFMHRKGVANR
jgi:serine/threonine-protein kinase SRK2